MYALVYCAIHKISYLDESDWELQQFGIPRCIINSYCIKDIHSYKLKFHKTYNRFCTWPDILNFRMAQKGKLTYTLELIWPIQKISLYLDGSDWQLQHFSLPQCIIISFCKKDACFYNPKFHKTYIRSCYMPYILKLFMAVIYKWPKNINRRTL
jgi:hypothetical protein